MLAKRVDFSASYIDNSIIFGTAHALLSTLLFVARSEAPDFLIKHAFIAGMLHFLPCVGTSMEPAPPAIFGNCADVIGWLKCPMGKSVLYAHAGTPREKKEEGDRKSKNVDSNDTSSKENKAVDYCLPRAEVFSATAQDNSRETLFFDDLLCCVTSVLKDIPEEHLSSTAVQDAFSRGLFFLLGRRSCPATMRAPSRSQHIYRSKGCSSLGLKHENSSRTC